MTDRNPHHLRIENCNVAEGNTIHYVFLSVFDCAAGSKRHMHMEAAARRPGIARDRPRLIAPASTIFAAEDTRSRTTTSAHRLAATTTSAPAFFRKTSSSSPNPTICRYLFSDNCLRPSHVALRTPPMPDRVCKLSRSWK